MKKILFAVLPYLLDRDTKDPTKKGRSFKAFPYGVLSIATFLKGKAEVRIFDANQPGYLDDFRAELKEFQPDVVGFSMMFDTSYSHLEDMLGVVREELSDAIAVLGGPAATASWDEIIRERPQLDAICYGEGELALERLCAAQDLRWQLSVDPVWVTQDSVRQGNRPQRSHLEDLDLVVDIDYSLVDVDSYAMEEAFSPFAGAKQAGRQFFVVTSRGCPFKCVFCIHSATDDRSMRYASVDRVVAHVRKLVEDHGMRVLTIYDDQILFNRPRAKALFRALAGLDIRIECPNGLSVAYLDDELVGLMKAAGMDTVCLAIESGSPHVLNNIIHKPLAVGMVKPIVEILRKHGFWIQGFFVSGLPGETDEHREETRVFIKDVGLDWSGFSLAFPTRGSKLHKICLENGFIEDARIGERDTNKYVIHLPGFAPDYIADYTYGMNLDVNFVHNRRIAFGDWTVAELCFSALRRKMPDHAFACYFHEMALRGAGRTEEADLARLDLERIMREENVFGKYFEHFGIRWWEAPPLLGAKAVGLPTYVSIQA